MVARCPWKFSQGHTTAIRFFLLHIQDVQAAYEILKDDARNRGQPRKELDLFQPLFYHVSLVAD